MSLSAAPEAVWALTGSGKIFIRKGITLSSPEGKDWVKLDLTQLNVRLKILNFRVKKCEYNIYIYFQNIQLKCISLGSDMVWAVDVNGSVWMRLGSLKPESSQLPVWIPVENSVGETPKFETVTVSAAIHIVWAIDENKSIYVRQGIFPDSSLGISWVQVPGIADRNGVMEDIVTLTASENSVWALTASGLLYKRSGISSSNFIGEAWHRMPSRTLFTNVSVSVCDTPYVLDASGKIAELQMGDISLSLPKVRGKGHQIGPTICEENVEDDWAMVEEM